LRFKKGVNFQGISPELILGLFVANEVYALYGVNMTVTSLLDSKHSRTSLHYSGNGADLRTRDLKAKADADKIAKEIKLRLGIHFDVIVESTHMHMEYQPHIS